MAKSLLQKSKFLPPANNMDNWETFGTLIQRHIAEIETIKFTKEQNRSEINKIVSGIPNPFARLNIFVYALLSTNTQTQIDTGLFQFYESILEEWKGLISSFILDSQNIETEIITLPTNTQNNEFFNLTTNLSKFLFDKTELYEDQNLVRNPAKEKEPKIEVIFYKNSQGIKVLIGGTSPECVVFTAPGYEINDKKVFIDSATKKFIDPVNNNEIELTAEDASKLIKYLDHIISKKDDFIRHFHSTELITGNRIYDSVISYLRTWRNRIQAYLSKKGFNFENLSPETTIFKENPFKILLSLSTELYVDQTGYVFRDNDGSRIVFRPEALLIPEGSKLAKFGITYFDGNELPVYFLKYKENANTTHFFSIPLTQMGVKVFGNQLNGLLELDAANFSNLSCNYNLVKNQLNVTLRLKSNTGESLTLVRRNYEVHIESITDKNIVIWPNFVSAQWNKYFLFSEMPHNEKNNWNVTPILCDSQRAELPIIDKAYIRDILNKDVTELPEGSFNIADNGGIKLGEIIVKNNQDVNGYKYEIYKSIYPFKGIEIKFASESVGFIYVKYKDEQLIQERFNPIPCRVGIDFGSNNTCISYKVGDTDTKLLDFTNRRISLFKSDIKLNEAGGYAKNFELLFFQNEIVKSNRIKSWLTIHKDGVAEAAVTEVAKGGFNCFEPKIDLEELKEGNQFNLKGGIVVKNNLKWNNNQGSNNFLSFIKIIFLQVYAELFYKGKTSEGQAYYPAFVNWAYPSAMSDGYVGQFASSWLRLIDDDNFPFNRNVFSNPLIELSVSRTRQSSETNHNQSNINPVFYRDLESSYKIPYDFHDKINVGGQFSLTEAFAVANYISATVAPPVGDYVIGLDIGGSTTDILTVTTILSNEGLPIQALVKQNSIKFAAGMLASSTANFANFGNLIRNNYIEAFAGVENINKENFPYYFNSLVDKNNFNLNNFYGNINIHCPNLIWVNLYITGVIMFYTGKMSKQIKKINEANPDIFGNFQRINIKFYGKGSRIFSWSEALISGVGNEYYKTCLIKGSGEVLNQNNFNIDINEILNINENQLKVEVSKGLASLPPASGKNYRIKDIGFKIAEILGETGYIENGIELDELTLVTPEVMRKIGVTIISNNEYLEFKKFLVIFERYARTYFNFNITLNDLLEEVKNISVFNKYTNDSDYLNNQASYATSPFILQALDYYEKVLIKKISNQSL
jgi:hypothetical protein